MSWIFCVLGLLLLLLAAAYVCFRLAFSVPKPKCEDLCSLLPKGEQYDAHRSEMAVMVKDAAALPYEDVWIDSDDGLKLHGKYYQAADGAPLQIMFHGYRSTPALDFSGGLPFALSSGYNVLLANQRAHGKSEGKCLTLGIKERYDCLAWTQYAVKRFGAETKIILYGMSMGAAAVLMAAGLTLPRNVKGIIADCGYTSPIDILKKVIRAYRYPVWPVYLLSRLGGMLYGGFDTESASAREAMTHCAIPVLFIHGEDDRFVPCEMSWENYRLCASENKRLLTVPHAGHGISYLEEKASYLNAVESFLMSL